jgi:uncharacterized protein
MKKYSWRAFSSVLLAAATVVMGLGAHSSAQSLEDRMRIAAGAYERKDFAQALSVWKPLAEQGNAEAQTLLGAMYWQGEGVARDHKEAARLYLLAAQQGYARAQYDIGFMYGFGEGIPPQDDVQAYKWIGLAIDRFTVKNQERREQAIKDRATLAARMSRQQLAEAEAAIKTWQPGK